MMGWEATMGQFASRYQRLSIQDAGFLYLEHAGLPQHIAILAVAEGGPLHDPDGRVRLDAVRQEVGRRLHHVARLRQLVLRPPLAQGLPLWVDDPPSTLPTTSASSSSPASVTSSSCWRCATSCACGCWTASTRCGSCDW